MNTTAHTPTPWRAMSVVGSNNRQWQVVNSDGNLIGYFPRQLAETIVADHNAHDSLKAQNAELVKALSVVANCIADDQGGTTLGSYEMAVVRAALAGVTP